MKSVFFSVLFTFAVTAAPCQVKVTDPGNLFNRLTQSKPDTGRINLFLQLASRNFDRVRLINRFDSVDFYLKKAQELNTHFNVTYFQNQINILAAKRLFALKPSTDPKNLFMPVIDSCKRSGDKENEAWAWVEMASKFPRDSQSLLAKLSCYEKALALSRELHQTEREMKALHGIAYVHFNQRKVELAEKELLYIMSDEVKTGPRMVMNTSDLLAALYASKGEYDKALQYALKTLKMIGVSGDSSTAGTAYGRISNIYYYLGKKEEYLAWANKSLDYKLATNNISGYYTDISSIAYLLTEQGKGADAVSFLKEQLAKRKPVTLSDQRNIETAFGDAYNQQKLYDLAEKHYLEMIRLGNDPASTISAEDKGYENSNMGSFYFRSGQYKKALPFLEVALQSYETTKVLPYIRNTHLWLYKTDSALGNYVSSIRHLQKSNEIADSIFKAARNKQIEELEVSYKTEQKDKNIRLLEEKEKFAEAQIRFEKNTRNWLIAGACMLLIIAGLLYRQAKIRKKTNTLINKKNDQLQHLVREKEWLLKEIHHRVKNNLHTVIGLLESQATYLEDDALKANEISKHRIYAMSLIHQQLYKTDDIKTIDMSVYLPELLDYLSDSFGTGKKILFTRSIDPVKLPVSQAIPVALIVNEAITNAIKYAFPADKPGEIRIRMNESPGKITLMIADDGIGIDPSIINAASTSMGLKLIRGLSNDLDGNINITNDNGTHISLCFQPDPVNEFGAV